MVSKQKNNNCNDRVSGAAGGGESKKEVPAFSVDALRGARKGTLNIKVVGTLIETSSSNSVTNSANTLWSWHDPPWPRLLAASSSTATVISWYLTHQSRG